ncbi:hypothetical protein HDV02_004234 [Globomyces sp. JEL0801]|nr:hypothetical protein HDV02_004234 [Globomyces sp. JEL0801]
MIQKVDEDNDVQKVDADNIAENHTAQLAQIPVINEILNSSSSPTELENLEIDSMNAVAAGNDVFEIFNIQRDEHKFVCNPYYSDLGPIKMSRDHFGANRKSTSLIKRLEYFRPKKSDPDLKFEITQKQLDFLENNRTQYKLVFTMALYKPHIKESLQLLPPKSLVFLDDEELVRAEEDNFGDGMDSNANVIDIFYFLKVRVRETGKP